MKKTGKILLLIGAICFLLAGCYSVYAFVHTLLLALKNNSFTGYDIVSLVIYLAFTLALIIGGLGGIFYAVGHGPFRSHVKPIAVTVIVLWAVLVVTAIFHYVGNGGNLFVDLLLTILYVGIPEVFYSLGYFLSKKEK